MKKKFMRWTALLCTLALVFTMAPVSMAASAISEDVNVESASDEMDVTDQGAEVSEEEIVDQEEVEDDQDKAVEQEKQEEKQEKEEVKEEKKDVEIQDNKDVQDADEKETKETSGKKAVKAVPIDDPSDKTFTVTLESDTFEYTGKDISPKVTKVVDGTGTDVDSANYDVSGSRKDVGTGTVTVTGKDSYDGYTGTATFTITAKPITDCSRTLAKTSYEYTGKEIKPDVTIKDGSTTLKKGTDYTVSYSKNKNVGTATVSVTGKGNYKGSFNMTFKINKGTQNLTVKVSKKKITVRKYGKITVKGNKGKLSFKSSNKKIAVVNSKGKVKGKYPGKVTITIKAKATSSYKAATKKVTLKILGEKLTKKNTKITLSKTKYTYDGKAKKPKVKVKYKKKTLKKGKDYKVTYEDNINAGKAKVIVKGKGYYVGTVKKAFKIKKAKNPMKATLDKDFVDLKKTIQIKVKKSKGNVTFTSSDKKIATVDKDGKITGKKTGVVKITVEAEGDDNYLPAKKVFKINVGLMDLSTSKCKITLSRTDYVYDGEYKKPTVVVRYNDKKLTEDKDYTLTYKNNKNAGKASVVITGKGNYYKSKTAQFTIEKATQSNFDVTVPGNHITYGGVTQVKVTGYYGSLSYSSKTTSYVVSLGGGRFQGLRKTGDEYAYIVISASGDSNHKAKTRTIGLKVY